MARKSLGKWIKALAAAAMFAVGTTGAHAQFTQCGEHADLVAHLAEKYQEKQVAYGTIGEVAVMEIFVGKTGSWTVVVTDLNGLSCIAAAGENWEGAIVLSGEGV